MGRTVVLKVRSVAAVAAFACVGLIMTALPAAGTGAHSASTATTSRISVAGNGAQGKAASGGAAMSADGRYLTFISSAANLVAGDTNARSDVFVRDRTANTTTRISTSGTGVQGN